MNRGAKTAAGGRLQEIGRRAHAALDHPESLRKLLELAAAEGLNAPPDATAACAFDAIKAAIENDAGLRARIGQAALAELPRVVYDMNPDAGDLQDLIDGALAAPPAAGPPPAAGAEALEYWHGLEAGGGRGPGPEKEEQ